MRRRERDGYHFNPYHSIEREGQLQQAGRSSETLTLAGLKAWSP